MNLFALTRQFIDLASVSGEEAEMGRFLAWYLEGLGYAVEMQEVAPTRSNIIATTRRAPRVVFSTHMDTVPPHIASSEDEAYIYGRGACDAKGIMAAEIVAAERLRAEGVQEIGLLFTVDEEVASLGARQANEYARARECRYLINGEPTDNLLATGSKGSLRVRLKTRGRAAHSAYPEHGESAIEKLLDALTMLRATAWPSDSFFGETTCNIGTISGGTRSNIVPAEAQADLHIRLATDSASIKEILNRGAAERGAELEYLSISERVRMLAVDGFAQGVVRFTTDIAYLPNWGTPLLLGPGSILDAHTTHERVSKRELTEAVDLYVRLARTLLARDDRALDAERQLVRRSEGADE
jgi:acetylornithine deacetylase